MIGRYFPAYLFHKETEFPIRETVSRTFQIAIGISSRQIVGVCVCSNFGGTTSRNVDRFGGRETSIVYMMFEQGGCAKSNNSYYRAAAVLASDKDAKKSPHRV